MGEAKLLTSNSIPTENKLLFGYDVCVAKYSLFWLETCDECRKRRLTVKWKEKVDWVPNRVAFIDVNGPLAVFWMILMSWLTGAVVVVLPHGGGVSDCLGSCTVCIASWAPSRVSCVTNASAAFWLVLSLGFNKFLTKWWKAPNGPVVRVSRWSNSSCFRFENDEGVTERREGGHSLEWETSRTELFLDLFALHYMN